MHGHAMAMLQGCSFGLALCGVNPRVFDGSSKQGLVVGPGDTDRRLRAGDIWRHLETETPLGAAVKSPNSGNDVTLGIERLGPENRKMPEMAGIDLF